jgi:Putative Actinobacterial Holin-X, holin superfamily III
MVLEREKSFGDALRDAVNNIGEIVRSEFELAKLEMRDTASKAVAPLRNTIAGAIFGLYAVGFLLLTIMFALRIVMPEWLAALIVFAIAAAIGGASIAAGIRGFKHINRPLERTAANVREQVQWARQQVR